MVFFSSRKEKRNLRVVQAKIQALHCLFELGLTVRYCQLVIGRSPKLDPNDQTRQGLVSILLRVFAWFQCVEFPVACVAPRPVLFANHQLPGAFSFNDF